ncbi:MAG: 2-oxoglutarate dehydrogenase E1 subunit family protein, partial [Acidimicrobiales bacterium]
MCAAEDSERVRRPESAARPSSAGSFGPNAWLVDDMYDRYLADPGSVAESWREFFSDYHPATLPSPAAPPPRPAAAPPASPPRWGTEPVREATGAAVPAPVPVPAPSPGSAPAAPPGTNAGSPGPPAPA